MNSTKPSGFRLVDLMILVAATAVGISLVDTRIWALMVFSVKGRGLGLGNGVAVVAVVLIPLLSSWTIGGLVIGLRPPRPTFWRPARRPGMVACLSVSIRLPLLDASMLVGGYHIHHRRPGQKFPDTLSMHLPDRLAYVVFGAWFDQWACGRWRPEASAIDRFGRMVGFGWIALELAALARTCFQGH